jgi:hypothetical protein
MGVTIMPEATYGSVAVRPAASPHQLQTLTDVLHKLRIVTGQDTLRAVSQLLGRDLAVLRAVPRDESGNLVARLTVSLHAGLGALTSTFLFAKD